MKTRGFIHLLIIFYFLPVALPAQQIVNLVLVGKDGVTDNIKKATSFILVKKYPGNVFERLDYIKGKPLTKLRTYNDSLLQFQEGAYLEYFPSGSLRIKGFFSNNLKEKDWFIYNDTGKHILTEIYKEGNLIASKVPDTIKKNDSATYKDEREADMKGGIQTWLKYIRTHLNADVAHNSVKGGQVRVMFIISPEGKVAEVYLKKSVEFVLDEEATRVIGASPDWIPAFQNGRTVNAYRIQPVTFIKQ